MTAQPLQTSDREESAADAPLPSIQVGGNESWERWRQAVRTYYDVAETTAGSAAPQVSLRGWKLDCMVASRTAITVGQIFKRTASHVRRENAEYLRVRTYEHASGGSLLSDDGCYALGPGKICMIDMSREYVEKSRPGRVRGLFVPHALVGYDPSVHPPVIEIDTASPLGYILNNAIFDLFEQLPRVTVPQAPELTAGIAAFLRAFVTSRLPDEAGPAFQAYRARALRDYLDRHLHDPQLGIESLTAKFGAARATIYRDFEKDGGVLRYITNRRLQKAYGDLARMPPRRGMIQYVADKWNFDSASHFCRLFRDKYGCTPGEVAGMFAVEDLRLIGDADSGPAHEVAFSAWKRTIMGWDGDAARPRLPERA